MENPCLPNSKSGWQLYGIWYAFQFVRQIHSRLIERDEKIGKLETDLLEWQNKTLSLANLKPLHHVPSIPPPALHRAPIGPTAKANMIREQREEKEQLTRPTDNEILDAANKVVGKNGNK